MRTKPSVMQDYLQLTKPRISMLCLLMFIGGYGYAAFLRGAPAANSYAEALGWLKFVFGMVGTWAAVASANVLNMVVERESDSLMRRTAGRPIPEGRLPWTHAAIFGVALGILSGALLGYVLIYTPLKRVTPQALIIGAVPGAMPPLMGWTSHQGGVDAVGLTLFGILLIWQVPHFMAIAIVHREDYMRAGIKVLPAVATERRAILEALVYSVALLAVSLALVPLAGAGAIYAVAAAGLGLWLIQLLWRGRHGMSTAQARGIFFASLVYLPALALALALDGAVVTWLGGPSLLPFSALP
jgi:protoheme IX farnesyltransferase